MKNISNIENFRHLIVGVDMKIPLPNGKQIRAINFDNAATTPPFHSVLNEIVRFSPYYSSIHRGSGYKSMISSKIYDDSRKIVADFVNADLRNDTIIYVKNTTEAINKLANKLCKDHKKYIILSTDMEHHSNDLPWRNKYKVDYIKIDEAGRLNLEDLEKKLIKYKNKVKLVTVSGASNVTGYKNPIHKIASLAHEYGSRILVDGAQLVPHSPVDMKPYSSKEHIDFLVFSSHKMYAPFGIGVLIGPKADFEYGAPDYKGGGTVKVVTKDYIEWADTPDKDEAGTPNVIGVVALTAAIKTLSSIGMDAIEDYEREITQYALDQLKSIPDISIYGNCEDCSDRVSIIPFNIRSMDHEVVSKALAYEKGISTRNGCFCAHPYVQKLLKMTENEINEFKKHPDIKRPGMVRISFGLYNTLEEVDSLIDFIKHLVYNKNIFINKYSE